MKADANRIRAALAKPVPDIRLYLLHGPDEAGARALTKLLPHAADPEAERVDIEPASLKAQPSRLADEAAAFSLFGGRRFIQLSGAGDETAEALELLIAAPVAGNPVVVIAPGVRTTSRIVKLALASPLALAFACYEPSAAQAEKLALDLARQYGLQPEQGIARRIAEGNNGDRAVMASELEKLALYLDAAPDRPRALDDRAIAAVGADLGDEGASALVEAVIAGRPADVGAALADLRRGGTSAIGWLRILSRKLVGIAELRAEADRGGDIDMAMKRQRVHFSEEAATRTAIRRWNPRRIAQVLDAIRRAERDVMAAATAGDILAEVAVLASSQSTGQR